MRVAVEKGEKRTAMRASMKPSLTSNWIKLLFRLLNCFFSRARSLSPLPGAEATATSWTLPNRLTLADESASNALGAGVKYCLHAAKRHIYVTLATR